MPMKHNICLSSKYDNIGATKPVDSHIIAYKTGI